MPSSFPPATPGIPLKIWDISPPVNVNSITLSPHTGTHAEAPMHYANGEASVDPATSQDLPGHHQLRVHGLRVPESLVLDDVPAGDYELIALPLKLMRANTLPVRAILRKLPLARPLPALSPKARGGNAPT